MTANLGAEIARPRNLGDIRVNQNLKIENIAMDMGITASGRKTPGLAPKNADGSVAVDDATVFRSNLGAVAYVTRLTRPDAAFCIAYLQRYQQYPLKCHERFLRQVVDYLLSTKDHGLIFQAKGRHPGLCGFVDADFADCDETRRSTTGFVYMFNGTPVSWASRRQKLVTTSSTEAEYVAATEAAAEGIWLRNLCLWLGEKVDDVLIYEDNQAVIARTLKAPHEFHKRSKHIDVKYHFIREKVQEGLVRLAYVNTAENAADILTKSLGTTEFLRKAPLLVGCLGAGSLGEKEQKKQRSNHLS